MAPSIEMLFSSVRLPLMLKPPLPRSAKPRLLNAPPMTPAFSPTTPIGLRPENESSSMSLASTVFRSATSVCSGVDFATTVTVSLSVPVSSDASTAMLAEASSVTPLLTHFLKPCSSTPRSVLAGRQRGKHEVPAFVGEDGAGEPGLHARRHDRGAGNHAAGLILDEAGDLPAIQLRERRGLNRAP